MNTPNNPNPKYCFSKKKPLKSILDKGGEFSLEISTIKKTNN